MSVNPWWQQAAAELNDEARNLAWQHQNQLTKPPGALGRLEVLATELAAMSGQPRPELHHPSPVLLIGHALHPPSPLLLLGRRQGGEKGGRYIRIYV